MFNLVVACFFVGGVAFLITGIVASLDERCKLTIASLIGALTCAAGAFCTIAHDNDTVEVKNLGVGTVISLNNFVTKHNVTTYTLVRLNGMDYTCYGYVPDAKQVTVIETKHPFSGRLAYDCQLPTE